MKVVRKLKCSFKIIFIGDGPEKARLEEETEKLGLKDKVFF